ncbi:response regulator [Siphonobacter curvatus]|uniref:Two-component system response regulator n=1 Tax=Siphonobacter curvatus TaxID=2094562 RepID=A0A2S7INU5_9BACT|nr:response regulator [Siphonobacter curvatus]PQA59404.1 two-component system response regulator [Siphonobacter curvatus]
MKKPLDFVLLMAEDDSDDQDLFKDALAHYYDPVKLRFVADGEECCDYLKRKGHYANPESSPRPDLILLDLNMPRKNGKEVLSEIKADDSLKSIPVIVFTTSRSPSDIQEAYQLGSNSYMVKPNSFRETLDLIQQLAGFWFTAAELPD